MAGPLVPAHLSFNDGIPFSEAFGDVYYSAASGPAQAQHVFLAGNRLPERRRGRPRSGILEVPDEAVRNRILVENPGRFYRFD